MVWAEGYLLKEWKHAVVVPTLKPGKNPSDPSSYHPVALTTVLCKIMEKMVTNRLVCLGDESLIGLRIFFLMKRTIQVMVGSVCSKTVEIENGTLQSSFT